MILTRIEAFEITVPLPRPLQLGAISIPNREYVIVRLHDADGNMGTAYGLTRNAPVAQTVLRTIMPHWLNQPLERHAQFYDQCVRANVCLGTNGILWRALSLCDCALYDLLAKRANQPLSVYLGGKPQVVPTVLVWGYPGPDETEASLQEQMRILQSYQPAGVKIASCGDYAHDTNRLAACRAVLPESIPLMIDLHWHAKDVQNLVLEARQWSVFNVGWLEDPFAFDDFDSLAALTESLDYPVCVGDEQTGLRQFQRLIEIGGIDIVRLDATVCGGLRAFIDICEMAAAHGIPVACHIFHHLHGNLAAALPNVNWIEYMLHESGIESIHEVWEDDLEWRDGGLCLSDRPGVGIAWDEDKLAYYRGVS